MSKVEMRVVWSWFTNWTDRQKHQFLDILVSKAVPRKVSSLLGAMESLSLQQTPNQKDLFHCQLRMFKEWFVRWGDEERNLFLNGLEERDYQAVQYFYEKVSQTAQLE